MGLFNFFAKKRKAKKDHSRRKKKLPVRNKKTIDKISTGIENLQYQLNTVNIALKKHDDELAEARQQVSQHSEQLEILEEKVHTSSIIPPIGNNTLAAQSIEIPNPSITPVQTTTDSTQKFDHYCPINF
ncbi:hypothetical protein ACFL3Q_10810 [Planctomycetota bacterium]